MQGIFRLVVFAACTEAITARPRERPVRMTVSMWLRPCPLQEGGMSVTLTHHINNHIFRSRPSPPCHSQELRCSQMRPAPMEALGLTARGRTPLTMDKKRSATDKSTVIAGYPWHKSRYAPSHGHRRRLRRHDPRRTPHSTSPPLREPLKTLGRRKGSRTRRPKRSAARVQYIGFRDVKFRLPGRLPLFLTVAPSGSSLRLGTFHANSSCFRVHKFEEITSSREGGWPVMLQVHGGSYLHGNASGLLSLAATEARAATVTQIDNLFFRINSYVGDNTIKLKHILTALHIQARTNGASLVSSDPLAAEGMLFYEFDCT